MVKTKQNKTQMKQKNNIKTTVKKKKLHPIFKDSNIRTTSYADLECMKSSMDYSTERMMDIDFLPTRLERSMMFLMIAFLTFAFMPICILYVLILGFHLLIRSLFRIPDNGGEY